jgi:antitoxin ParD1/3/4
MKRGAAIDTFLEEREQRRLSALEPLRAEISAGRTSGPTKPAEEVLDRLAAKYSAQVKGQQR